MFLTAEDALNTIHATVGIAKAAAGWKVLPDGLMADPVDGSILFRCTRCDQWAELPVSPEEYDPDGINMCGGSPRCCP